MTINADNIRKVRQQRVRDLETRRDLLLHDLVENTNELVWARALLAEVLD